MTETPTAHVTTDLYDADQDPVTTPAEDQVSTTPQTNQSDAFTSTSDAASTALPETYLHEAEPADKGPVNVHSNTEASAAPTESDRDEAVPAPESTEVDSDGASASSSTNHQRNPLKHSKRFFSRLFRAMCCCCSAAVDD